MIDLYNNVTIIIDQSEKTSRYIMRIAYYRVIAILTVEQ